jgi:hypothetical protein
LRDLEIYGKFKTTSHLNIMEQLRKGADRFRKQGRLQDQEMEENNTSPQGRGRAREQQ